MSKVRREVKDVIYSSEQALWQRKRYGDEIPRFSKKHATITDYLQSKDFSESKPEYQRRILKQAMENPHWTLAEARGHSKRTGNTWQTFDELGKISGMQEFKNRKEEAKYSEYLNAVKSALDTGSDDKLKAWKKRWGSQAKEFITADSQKIKSVTDVLHLQYLNEFNELPSGAEIYVKG